MKSQTELESLTAQVSQYVAIAPEPPGTVSKFVTDASSVNNKAAGALESIAKIVPPPFNAPLKLIAGSISLVHRVASSQFQCQVLSRRIGGLTPALVAMGRVKAAQLELREKQRKEQQQQEQEGEGTGEVPVSATAMTSYSRQQEEPATQSSSSSPSSFSSSSSSTLDLDMTERIVDGLTKIIQQATALIECFLPPHPTASDSSGATTKATRMQKFANWCSKQKASLLNPAEDFQKIHTNLDRALQDLNFATTMAEKQLQLEKDSLVVAVPPAPTLNEIRESIQQELRVMQQELDAAVKEGAAANLAETRQVAELVKGAQSALQSELAAHKKIAVDTNEKVSKVLSLIQRGVLTIRDSSGGAGGGKGSLSAEEIKKQCETIRKKAATRYQQHFASQLGSGRVVEASSLFVALRLQQKVNRDNKEDDNNDHENNENDNIDASGGSAGVSSPGMNTFSSSSSPLPTSLSSQATAAASGGMQIQQQTTTSEEDMMYSEALEQSSGFLFDEKGRQLFYNNPEEKQKLLAQIRQKHLLSTTASSSSSSSPPSSPKPEKIKRQNIAIHENDGEYVSALNLPERMRSDPAVIQIATGPGGSGKTVFVQQLAIEQNFAEAVLVFVPLRELRSVSSSSSSSSSKLTSVFELLEATAVRHKVLTRKDAEDICSLEIPVLWLVDGLDEVVLNPDAGMRRFLTNFVDPRNREFNQTDPEFADFVRPCDLVLVTSREESIQSRFLDLTRGSVSRWIVQRWTESAQREYCNKWFKHVAFGSVSSSASSSSAATSAASSSSKNKNSNTMNKKEQQIASATDDVIDCMKRLPEAFAGLALFVNMMCEVRKRRGSLHDVTASVAFEEMMELSWSRSKERIENFLAARRKQEAALVEKEKRREQRRREKRRLEEGSDSEEEEDDDENNQGNEKGKGENKNNNNNNNNSTKNKKKEEKKLRLEQERNLLLKSFSSSSLQEFFSFMMSFASKAAYHQLVADPDGDVTALSFEPDFEEMEREEEDQDEQEEFDNEQQQQQQQQEGEDDECGDNNNNLLAQTNNSDIPLYALLLQTAGLVRFETECSVRFGHRSTIEFLCARFASLNPAQCFLIRPIANPAWLRVSSRHENAQHALMRIRMAAIGEEQKRLGAPASADVVQLKFRPEFSTVWLLLADLARRNTELNAKEDEKREKKLSKLVKELRETETQTRRAIEQEEEQERARSVWCEQEARAEVVSAAAERKRREKQEKEQQEAKLKKEREEAEKRRQEQKFEPISENSQQEQGQEKEEEEEKSFFACIFSCCTSSDSSAAKVKPYSSPSQVIAPVNTSSSSSSSASQLQQQQQERKREQQSAMVMTPAEARNEVVNQQEQEQQQRFKSKENNNTGIAATSSERETKNENESEVEVEKQKLEKRKKEEVNNNDNNNSKSDQKEQEKEVEDVKFDVYYEASDADILIANRKANSAKHNALLAQVEAVEEELAEIENEIAREIPLRAVKFPTRSILSDPWYLERYSRALVLQKQLVKLELESSLALAQRKVSSLHAVKKTRYNRIALLVKNKEAEVAKAEEEKLKQSLELELDEKRRALAHDEEQLKLAQAPIDAKFPELATKYQERLKEGLGKFERLVATEEKLREQETQDLSSMLRRQNLDFSFLTRFAANWMTRCVQQFSQYRDSPAERSASLHRYEDHVFKANPWPTEKSDASYFLSLLLRLLTSLPVAACLEQFRTLAPVLLPDDALADANKKEIAKISRELEYMHPIEVTAPAVEMMEASSFTLFLRWLLELAPSLGALNVFKWIETNHPESVTKSTLQAAVSRGLDFMSTTPAVNAAIEHIFAKHENVQPKLLDALRTRSLVAVSRAVEKYKWIFTERRVDDEEETKKQYEMEDYKFVDALSAELLPSSTNIDLAAALLFCPTQVENWKKVLTRSMLQLLVFFVLPAEMRVWIEKKKDFESRTRQDLAKLFELPSPDQVPIDHLVTFTERNVMLLTHGLLPRDMLSSIEVPEEIVEDHLKPEDPTSEEPKTLLPLRYDARFSFAPKTLEKLDLFGVCKLLQPFLNFGGEGPFEKLNLVDVLQSNSQILKFIRLPRFLVESEAKRQKEKQEKKQEEEMLHKQAAAASSSNENESKTEEQEEVPELVLTFPLLEYLGITRLNAPAVSFVAPKLKTLAIHRGWLYEMNLQGFKQEPPTQLETVLFSEFLTPVDLAEFFGKTCSKSALKKVSLDGIQPETSNFSSSAVAEEIVAAGTLAKVHGMSLRELTLLSVLSEFCDNPDYKAIVQHCVQLTSVTLLVAPWWFSGEFFSKCPSVKTIEHFCSEDPSISEKVVDSFLQSEWSAPNLKFLGEVDATKVKLAKLQKKFPDLKIKSKISFTLADAGDEEEK